MTCYANFRDTTLAIILVLVLVAVVRAQNATTAEQHEVEEAADRVMQHLYSTLDFGAIWRDDSTSNQSFREEEVYVLMRQLLWDSKVRIPFAEQERAYVAQRNFFLVLSAVRFTNPEEFRSTGFEEELKQPYESITGIKRPIVSAQDLDSRFIDPMARMSALLRKRVKPSVYNSDAYKSDVARVAEDNQDEAARLRGIFEPVGLSSNTKIYVARREIYYLYFIREGATLKLLTLSSRLRD